MYSLRILQCTRVTVRLSVQTRNLSAQEVFGNVDLNVCFDFQLLKSQRIL